MTTQTKLLEAANRVAARDGVAKLTLDAVALEAGMSKGIILYHFHSKNALIQAMIDQLIAKFELGFAEQALAWEEDVAPGHALRAMIRAQLPPPGDSPEDPSPALLAAVGNDPRLLDSLRARYTVWQEQITGDGLDPALATVLRLATDGLWVCELFGLAPPTGAFRAEVIARMLTLAGPDKPEE